jgi:hypothetical protein
MCPKLSNLCLKKGRTFIVRPFSWNLRRPISKTLTVHARSPMFSIVV